ncbi:hypothetical protein [Colwellia sp. TT2012]|uniref:hypothetical protein n=1 Tax=Colwellia sp. TT2012 TaxID=1720342 RepID=UPI0012F7C9BA|nr:hypothetical protein [Colwellia sp. TT2012]
MLIERLAGFGFLLFAVYFSHIFSPYSLLPIEYQYGYVVNVIFEVPVRRSITF